MKFSSKIFLLTIVVFIYSNELFTQVDAISILPNGNVGIATNSPKSSLDINGSLNTQSATISNALKANSGYFSNTLTASGGLFSENAVVNTALIGKVGLGSEWSCFSHKDAPRTSKAYGFTHYKDGTWALMNIKSGNGHIGFRVDNEDKMIVNSAGNVGIGELTPKHKLHVNGSVQASDVNVSETVQAKNVTVESLIKAKVIEAAHTINAPFINGIQHFQYIAVGSKYRADDWQAVNEDIGNLCGDGDGCVMRILLTNTSNDQVRMIVEHIYIEQAETSLNKNKGLSGFTYELAGNEQYFVLDTEEKQDIIPKPWGWLYVRNYGDPQFKNLPQGVYSGFNVQFKVPKDIIARIVIYD